MDETQRDSDSGLEDRLRFEALLADLSAGFINLPADRIDSGIEDALRRLCECLDVDRCVLWQRATDAPDVFRLTHVYQSSAYPPVAQPDPGARIDREWALGHEDIAPAIMHSAANTFFPRLVDRTLAGKTFVVSSPSDLPADAAPDAEMLRRFGVKSAVVVPLAAAGTVFGAMTLDTLTRDRNWPDPLVKRFELVGQILANALLRKRADETLRASEERLGRAAVEWKGTFDSVRDPVMILDRDYRITHANAAAAELTGLSQERVIGGTCHLLVHGADSPVENCPVARMFESGAHEESEIYIERRNMWLLISADPILGQDGSLVGVVHTAKDITGRKRAEEDLRKAYVEIQKLKDRLQQENIYLRKEIRGAQGADEIVGKSDALNYVRFRVDQVAPMDTTVLLMGETGTGKGVIARLIHEKSPRRDKAFVTVNCAALPANLIESELFGREKGAFTGSTERQMGRFELADGGTIFLDEIGEMPLELQAKLLRAIQDGEFERLGSPRTVKVNVRIIASTNRNLEEAVRDRSFREDLFYRLHVFPITIPPLRQRMEDIPLLAQHFLMKFSTKARKAIASVAPDVLDALTGYSWPGNVRELESVIERAVITTQGFELELAQTLTAAGAPPVPARPAVAAAPDSTLAEMERRHILTALSAAGWKLEGAAGAAEALGMNASTLRARMRKHGIKRPRPS